MSHHVLPHHNLEQVQTMVPCLPRGPQAGKLPVVGARKGPGSEKEFCFKMKKLGTSLVVQW